MAKRSKEEREEERKKELLRTLRRGPDLDRYIDERKRTFVSYAQGARMYSMKPNLQERKWRCEHVHYRR